MKMLHKVLILGTFFISSAGIIMIVLREFSAPILQGIAASLLLGLMIYIVYLHKRLTNNKLEIQSLRNPHTGLQTKYELYKKSKTEILKNRYLTYFSIDNFQDIINICGVSYAPMIETMVKEKILRIVPDADIYEIKETTHLLMTHYPIDIQQIILEFDKPLQGLNHVDTFNLKAKVITLDYKLTPSKTIHEILQLFEYAYNSLEITNQHVLRIQTDFIKQMEEETYFKSHIESALKNDAIIAYFQPKYSPKNQKIIGAEALSRWVDQNTLISPNKFIHIAEASGLIVDVDLIAFKHACKLIKTLRDQKLLDPHFKVSTNLSAITLKNLDIKTLKTIIEKHQINPQHLSVEITESIAIDYQVIKPLLSAIDTLGISIEIDDFSAGNASLTALTFMHASYIKIDRAVLPTHFEASSDEVMIYQGVVKLLKQLGFMIVSEGVETKAQESFIRSLDIPIIQGYYFSKPMPKTAFINFLKAHQ